MPSSSTNYSLSLLPLFYSSLSSLLPATPCLCLPSLSSLRPPLGSLSFLCLFTPSRQFFQAFLSLFPPTAFSYLHIFFSSIRMIVRMSILLRYPSHTEPCGRHHANLLPSRYIILRAHFFPCSPSIRLIPIVFSVSLVAWRSFIHFRLMLCSKNTCFWHVNAVLECPGVMFSEEAYDRTLTTKVQHNE